MTNLNLRSELERLRERLLDLSMRNPLLNYRKSQRRTLQITNELPSIVYSRLVEEGKPFRLDFASEPPPKSPMAPGKKEETAVNPGDHSSAFYTSERSTNGPMVSPKPSAEETNISATTPLRSVDQKIGRHSTSANDHQAGSPTSPHAPALRSDEADGTPNHDTDVAVPRGGMDPTVTNVPSEESYELPRNPADDDVLNAADVDESKPTKHLYDDRLQTNLSRDKLESLVRFIRREATTALQETGINYLHLALGFLAWQETDAASTQRLAPLVLIPISIESVTDRRTGQTKFTVTWTEDDVTGNACLLKKLQQDFGITLPDYPPDSDPESYFAEIAARTERMPNWSVKREALIGFFSFHKLSMYHDIDPGQWSNDLDTAKESLLEQIICGASGPPPNEVSLYAQDYDIDNNKIAEEILLPMDADSSQHSALCDIREGKNLVIEGPPGTGKSQTISNAIADAIASGKTVLFVAEKMTALHVVYERLEALGLGSFCLELHSDSGSPRHVYESLQERLAATYTTPTELQACRESLESLRATLNRYVDEMGRPVGPNADPLYDVIWQIIALRNEGAKTCPQQAHRNGPPTRTIFQTAARALEVFSAQLTEHPAPLQNPWWGYFPDVLSFQNFPVITARVASILNAIGRFHAEADKLTSILGIEGPTLLQIANSVDSDQLNVVTSRLPETLVSELRALATPSSLEQVRRLLSLLKDQTTGIFTFEKRYGLTYNKAIVNLQRLEEGLRILGTSTLTPDQLIGAITVSKSNLSSPPVTTEDQAVSLHEPIRCGVISLKSRDSRLINLTELFQLKEWSQQVSHLLQSMLTVSDSVALSHLEPICSLDDVRRALKTLQLLHHPAVANDSALTQNQFTIEGRRTYREAKKICDQLLSTKESLQPLFHFPSIPSSEEIDSLSRVLRRHYNSWLRFFNPAYRKSKARINEFIAIGSSRSITQRIHDLEKLKTFVDECHAFATNPEFQQVLGPKFNGIDTEWEELRTVFDWVHTIQGLGFSYEQVVQLLRTRRESNHQVSIADLRRLVKSFDELQSQQSQFTSAVLVVEGTDSLPLTQLYADFLAFRQRIDNFLEHILSTLERLNQTQRACGVTDLSIAALGQLVSDLQTLENRNSELHDKTLWSDLISTGLHAKVTIESAKMTEACQWLSELRDNLSGLPDRTVAAILAVENPKSQLALLASTTESLRDLHTSILQDIETLKTYAATAPDWFAINTKDLFAKTFSDRIEAMFRSAETLPAWSAFGQAYRHCRELGLENYCNAAMEGKIPNKNLAASYQLTELEFAAESAIRESKMLQETNGASLDVLRKEFQYYDRQLRDLHRNEIALRASQRVVPVGNSRGRVGELTELALIRHETQKQKRHCRIRDLIVRAGLATQALKPCFMMSPLSVARFIPQDSLTFDMVIMDEASQIKPEDAVGTIMRAKQLIVVGDPKQLPPTSFFDRIDEEIDEDESTLLDNTESILEATMKVFQPFRRLRWHYRSRHESLIRFSNFRFYDNDLVVFPSTTADSGAMGVNSVFVKNATFTGGVNVREAETMVEAIIHHALTKSHQSLGVGTFNKKQAELIYDLLEKRCSEDAKARLAIDRLNEHEDELFIKNIENVQGDERDVIFIGYTYGPDPDSGRLFQRFGPINAEKGWRRLNVLITRSRKRMVVFHSFMPSDIHGGPDKSRGVNAYKDFLNYAITGTLDEPGVVEGRSPDSPFEIAVCRSIQSMGLEAVPQVGVAGFFVDIGVRRREGDKTFLLGVECDGATYHSARSARDRDRLREEIITSRGWQIHRIWSTDWFLNQRQEEEKLRRVLSEKLSS